MRKNASNDLYAAIDALSGGQLKMATDGGVSQSGTKNPTTDGVPADADKGKSAPASPGARAAENSKDVASSMPAQLDNLSDKPGAGNTGDSKPQSSGDVLTQTAAGEKQKEAAPGSGNTGDSKSPTSGKAELTQTASGEGSPKAKPSPSVEELTKLSSADLAAELLAGADELVKLAADEAAAETKVAAAAPAATKLIDRMLYEATVKQAAATGVYEEQSAEVFAEFLKLAGDSDVKQRLAMMVLDTVKQAEEAAEDSADAMDGALGMMAEQPEQVAQEVMSALSDEDRATLTKVLEVYAAEGPEAAAAAAEQAGQAVAEAFKILAATDHLGQLVQEEAGESAAHEASESPAEEAAEHAKQANHELDGDSKAALIQALDEVDSLDPEELQQMAEQITDPEAKATFEALIENHQLLVACLEAHAAGDDATVAEIAGQMDPDTQEILADVLESGEGAAPAAESADQVADEVADLDPEEKAQAADEIAGKGEEKAASARDFVMLKLAADMAAADPAAMAAAAPEAVQPGGQIDVAKLEQVLSSLTPAELEALIQMITQGPPPQAAGAAAPAPAPVAGPAPVM